MCPAWHRWVCRFCHIALSGFRFRTGGSPYRNATDNGVNSCHSTHAPGSRANESQMTVLSLLLPSLAVGIIATIVARRETSRSNPRSGVLKFYCLAVGLSVGVTIALLCGGGFQHSMKLRGRSRGAFGVRRHADAGAAAKALNLAVACLPTAKAVSRFACHRTPY